MAGPIEAMRYWVIEFDKSGGIVADDNLPNDLPASGIQDLLVLSHGWNNSEMGARGLYGDLFAKVAGMLREQRKATTGFVGVLWPSMLFPEDGPADDGSPAPAVTTSGAQLAAALKDKFPGQEQDVETLGSMLDTREQDGAALEIFHQLATGLVTTPATGGEEDRGEAAAMNVPARDALMELAAAPGEPPPDSQGIFDVFDTAWNGARELLRTMSYYEMKNRAGVVGKNGLGPMLGRLAQATPGLRVHLIGHSFGARLVAFSLVGLPAGMRGAASPVKSLLLIQGAFSHFAFSRQKPGALQEVADRVDGPLLCTFSKHDRAVGLWYPNASRLARQDNQDLDDFNFRWGGMGHDGYQQDGVVDRSLQAVGILYKFEKGTFYRLDGNNVIKKSLSAFSQAHSDIRHREVAWAAVSAAGLDEG
jgi:hypothetical protein